MPADPADTIPATAVVDELVKLTAKLLATLDEGVAEVEAEQELKRANLRMLVEQQRQAVERATTKLNELYQAAREIADNKARRDVLEGVLRRPAQVDTTRNFDEVVVDLEQEMKLARGITGAIRIEAIGALLNQAAVQVDYLENMADALEKNLRDASKVDPVETRAHAEFEKDLTTLRRDLLAFDTALPLSARSWDSVEWLGWQQPAEPMRWVRFGQITDDRLDELGIPALAEFPGDPGLFIETTDHRERALEAARAIVLRILAAFPPGAVRFTFIDPKGLGESVAPFLALAGGDAPIVDGVATIESEIERALVDLSRHVEHVIQTRLAGQHGTLEAFHRAVGEIVEPYRFLFVFDHPTSFTKQAVLQLRTLTETGPASGLHTIVFRDPKPGFVAREARALPALRQIKANADGFQIGANGTMWKLVLDEPPDPADGVGTEVLRRAVEQVHAKPRVVVVDEPVVDVAKLEQATVGGPDAGAVDRDESITVQLGEPVEPGSPVEVRFHRDDGANLLVVADNEAVGQGVLAGAITTAARSTVPRLEIRVLDFMPIESGFGEAALALGDRAEVVVGRRRNFTRMLEQVHGLVRTRLDDPRGRRTPCLFVVNGLEHARELDVGATGDAAGGDRAVFARLEEIVQSGPSVGVHTLLWARSRDTLDQRLTRDIVNAFALRVVGPMDEQTSDELIESTAAASLPPWQVVLYDEFRSRLVPFRPYAVPKRTWTDTGTAMTPSVAPTELA
jgi:hypothetical protein